MLANQKQDQPSEASSYRTDSSDQQQGYSKEYKDQPTWVIQGTKQERQQPKLSPEELVGMQTASYALLNQLLAVIGKKERGGLIAISEALCAFKENKASELEVIACFFKQIKDGNVSGLENKKAILAELATSIPTEHSEQLWQYIRKWAGTRGNSLAYFNSYLANNDSKETIAFHAKNWFIQQQSEALATMQAKQQAKLAAEMEEIAAKSESKIASTREEKIAALANKASRAKLTDEEITYLFTFADDEITNKAMEAQMELASKQQAKEKIRSGNISSEDI